MGEMADMYGEWPDGPAGTWNPDDDPPDEEVECVNCDRPLGEPKRPYLFCSELCKQEAAYVRYNRRVHRDERFKLPDVQEAINIRLALILGGGYPARERHLSPEARAAIVTREGGRFRLCGAPATEIDHIAGPIDGDINHPDNLQALCHDCHTAKTLSGLVPITPESHPDEWAKAQALQARVDAPIPLRPCDDDENWAAEWRQFAAERRVMQEGR